MSDTCNKSDIGNTEATSPDTPLENAFCTKTWRTDLALIVEEDTLYVSKHVLAIVSPVFEAMFSGDYEENSKDELSLPEKKYVDVLEFLQCIYPNLMKPVTLENVYAVLPLADEYQVAMLQDACESCLLTCLTDDISSDQLYDILTKANTFNLSCVMEKCIDKAADRPYTEIDNADTTVTLAEDMKIKIKDRMLQNLSTNCNNMSQLIDTSKALCTFLGAGAKQKNLVNQYVSLGIANRFELAHRMPMPPI